MQFCAIHPRPEGRGFLLPGYRGQSARLAQAFTGRDGQPSRALLVGHRPLCTVFSNVREAYIY